jgi:hypothetical protein
MEELSVDWLAIFVKVFDEILLVALALRISVSATLASISLKIVVALLRQHIGGSFVNQQSRSFTPQNVNL